MIKSLGLKVSETSSRIKAVNSQAQPVLRMANAMDVKLEIGLAKAQPHGGPSR